MSNMGNVLRHVANNAGVLMGGISYFNKDSFYKFVQNKLGDKSIDLGYDYQTLKKEYKESDTNIYLYDMIIINWAHSTDEGLESVAICFKDYLKHIAGDGIADIFEINNHEIPRQREEPKKQQPQEEQPQKKEVEKAAAIDSTPTEHDLWMFELGRRQALGENYQGPLNPQQQQMILQQGSQTESPITSPQDKSNLSPKLVTQKEMISCIKEFTSQFPAIYGEKFIKEIMEKDSCTLKGHGHDYIKLYQACHGADAVSDNQLTNRIILEIDWIYSYKEFMADIGELFVEYTLKHMPSSEQFMKNDD